MPRERPAARPGGDALPCARLHRSRWPPPPRHDHADLQRALVQHRGLPRPPRPADRARGARRRARPGPGGPPDRRRAAARGRHHRDRGGAHLRVPGRVHQLLRDPSHPPAHGGQRRPRPHGPRAPGRDHVQPRAVEPGPLLQPDAGPPARGPRRDQPGGAGAGGQGGGAHGPAPAGAEAPPPGRPTGLARPARRQRRPRDQQPALRRPQLLRPHGTHPQGRRGPEGAGARVPRLPRARHRADGAGRAHRLRPPRLLAPVEAPARPGRPQRHRAGNGGPRVAQAEAAERRGDPASSTRRCPPSPATPPRCSRSSSTW